jgi:addiction module HigA family antidote
MESGSPVLPAHPGEVLKSDYLERLGISADELADSAAIPAARIRDILAGRRAITADAATRLADRLGTTAEFWTSLPANYDLAIVSHAWSQRPPTQPKRLRRRR